MAGGAARPVAGATDEDAGPVADDNAEGPVASGGDAARSLADDSAEEPVAGGRSNNADNTNNDNNIDTNMQLLIRLISYFPNNLITISSNNMKDKKGNTIIDKNSRS